MTQEILETITIKAPVYRVWDTLTRTDLMQQWMGDPEMHVEVITDWEVGSPIVIKGFHHVAFENKGMEDHHTHHEKTGRAVCLITKPNSPGQAGFYSLFHQYSCVIGVKLQ